MSAWLLVALLMLAFFTALSGLVWLTLAVCGVAFLSAAVVAQEVQK